MSSAETLPARTAAARGGVRLRSLVLIRWAAVAGQAFTAAVVHWGLGFHMPILWVGVAIGMSALLNVAVSFGRPGAARLDDREAAVFLAFDILQLATLLYLTGGLANPFCILLLSPVAVAATILSLPSTLALSLLTILSASVIAISNRPLPWDGPPPELPLVYQSGLWVGLVLTTLLITLYAWRLAEEARQMTAAIEAANAALTREQRLSALGALAAAAAHELGTPLSTIQLVAREMQKELEPDDPWVEDVGLLASESERCRAILARLSVDPAGDVSEAYTVVPLPALVEAAAQPWGRDGVELAFTAGPADPAQPRIAPVQVRSPELLQGIGNIVHNAAGFARRRVEIATVWRRDSVEVSVTDDGPGFSEAILDEIGSPFISTREGADGHMGLGVFIAKTLLERTGGTVAFANRPAEEGTGAKVTVYWKNPTFRAT